MSTSHPHDRRACSSEPARGLSGRATAQLAASRLAAITHFIACEWGEWGVRSLLTVADVFIIVDVLSFSTCVDIAVSRGATVWPYPWKDGSARQFARAKGALLAGKRGDRYSLSPASLGDLPADSQLVLLSPNGATLSLATAGKPTLGGQGRAESGQAHRRHPGGRTVAGRQLATVLRGLDWRGRDYRALAGQAFARSGSGVGGVALGPAAATGTVARLSVGPGTHRARVPAGRGGRRRNECQFERAGSARWRVPAAVIRVNGAPAGFRPIV